MAKKRKQKVLKAPVQQSKADSISSINSEVIAAALSSLPIMMKMCRLCENKDGPFLNIFDFEQGITRKIDMLLPFTIAENDDLPHKICFRCSAKVEELHDFVQKCIKTQENLRKTLGKQGNFITKSNTRKVWEDKLNKSNMSNAEICQAVIEKAMEGMENMPLKPSPEKETQLLKRPGKLENIVDQIDELPKKRTRSSLESEKPSVLSLQSSSELERLEMSSKVPKSINQEKKRNIIENKNQIVLDVANENKKELANSIEKEKEMVKVVEKEVVEEVRLKRSTRNKGDATSSVTIIDSDNESNNETKYKEGNFTYISMKENNKKEPQLQPREKIKPEPVPVSAPEPAPQTAPETSEVKEAFDIKKYISTIKVNHVGVLYQCKLCNRNFLKQDVILTHSCARNGAPKVDKPPSIPKVEPPKKTVPSVKYINSTPKVTDENKPEPVKPKPKIGPASKTKKNVEPEIPSVGMKVTPRPPTPPAAPATATLTSAPTIELPSVTGLKSRYKLLPGPNNTFTLVEDNGSAPVESTSHSKSEPVSETQSNDIPPSKPEHQHKSVNKSKSKGPKSKIKKSSPIDVDPTPHEPIEKPDKPYPVGLFQATPTPATFTTPAMRKQSYTIVQTGNPSKLLISTKPQPQVQTIEPPKPKSKKKSRQEIHTEPEASKQSNSDPVEDNQDTAFFNFINVDPLLQPSYVLPIDNIIQESQITTSTQEAAANSKSKELYECTMCPEKFSREKKLLTHIQAHYNKMDEESNEKSSKRRSRRS